ncbi:MAG: DUF2911 domain-containing protein [Gloeobacteraceae cyanobacterium ES-bin-316]|nr:DUF2911 domain-containing protein [Ferruginibacter sp.]
MKTVAAIALFLGISVACVAQSKLPPVDKSPLDISYYPDNYPVLKIQDKVTEPLVARIIYSRPQKNTRVVFGELIEYGKVWRLGANEATEIEFYLPVKINNVKIKKGRYSIYAIPNAEKWTIIINKENDTWGSFRYDPKKDIVRMDVPVQKQATPTESFCLMFEKAAAGFVLNALWDDVKVSLPVSLQ